MVQVPYSASKRCPAGTPDPPDSVRRLSPPAQPSRRRVLVRAAVSTLIWLLLVELSSATPAYAATGDVVSLLDSVRNWLAGLLAALATLFLTYGGIRYLTAGGNPRAVEEGKAAIRSALIGYALAGLAPIFVSTLRQVVGI